MKKIKILLIFILFSFIWISSYSQENTKVVYDFKFFQNKETYAIASDSFISIIDVTSKVAAYKLENKNADSFISIDISKDEKYIVSGSKNGIISLWNIEKQELIFETKLVGSITDIKFSSNNTFIASSSNNKLYKYNYLSKNLIKEFKGHTLDITSIEFTKDEKYLVSSSADMKIIIWDYDSGEIINTLEDHDAWIRDISVNQQNQMISCDDDGKLFFWDLSNVNDIKLFKQEEVSKKWITCIKFNDDGISYAYGTINGEAFYITPKLKLKSELKYPILNIEITNNDNLATIFLALLGNGFQSIPQTKMAVYKYIL